MVLNAISAQEAGDEQSYREIYEDIGEEFSKFGRIKTYVLVFAHFDSCFLLLHFNSICLLSSFPSISRLTLYRHQLVIPRPPPPLNASQRRLDQYGTTNPTFSDDEAAHDPRKNEASGIRWGRKNLYRL